MSFIDELNGTFVIQIIIWTILIVIICTIAISIYHGFQPMEFPKALMFLILYILQPLKVILTPLKNILYYLLPSAWRAFLPKFDKTDPCMIGKGWTEKYRLSTLVILTTLILGSLTGYVVLNPNKFSTLYGRIITYILVVISIILGFKSAILFTHSKDTDFRKNSELRSTFEEQRNVLFKNTLNYVKVGVISIVVLAILGISAFYVSINDNVARSATTVICWLFISFGLLVAYLYSKELAITKSLMKNDIFKLIYNIIFLIPCFFLEFIQASYNELKYTPNWTWVILIIELIIISVYILGPIINKAFYLDVQSDELKSGGTRYKQEIKILKKDNEDKIKEIEELKKSDAYPELTPGFFGANQQLFWRNVLDEMLWAPNEEERLIYLLKNMLWDKALNEQKLGEEDVKEYNERQYFLNLRQRDQWYEEESAKKGWTFLEKLKKKENINYNKETIEKLINFTKSNKTILGLKNTNNINSLTNELLQQKTYLLIPDISIKDSDTPAEKKTKITKYLKALADDIDYTRIEHKRLKSKLEEDGGMIYYVQQQGRKMSRVYNEIDENNEKIKLLEQRIGTTTGHPKTVMIINKPQSLARKHKPKKGAYPSIRYGENEGGGPISEIDGDYNYDFALSSWIFLHAQAPNFYKGISSEKNILNLVGNDNVSSLQLLYDLKNNTLILKTKLTSIKIPKIKLQKWINLVINYNRGNLDIFMDGQLVKTLPGSVWEMGDELSLAVGENKGIRGGICNLVHFAASLTKPQIENNYNAFKDKDPPVA